MDSAPPSANPLLDNNRPAATSKTSSATYNSSPAMDNGALLIKFLRVWVGIAGLMAFANTIQGYIKPDFVWENLYNAPGGLNKTTSLSTKQLTARIYGMWTLLAGVVRIIYVTNPYNWEMFLATMVTLLIALGHFLVELLYFQTGLAHLNGMLFPILLAVVSVPVMLMSIPYLWPAGVAGQGRRKLN